MNRIDATFARLQAAGRTALIPYVTTGDPSLEGTLDVMRALVMGGADVIELGVPFSDPMADGPVIQRASERALANGTGLKDVLAVVRAFRDRNETTPIVLMGYANPIEAMGAAVFADRARDGVTTLSGGQQQRVLIARALAGEPELFFLDEPTAGVDLPNQQVLADTLRTLSERGSTIVLVAHELGPMAPLIDRAVVMRDGRVSYDGPPLASEEVATAHLDGHQHHHPEPGRHDHAPHIASPLEWGS